MSTKSVIKLKNLPRKAMISVLLMAEYIVNKKKFDESWAEVIHQGKRYVTSFSWDFPDQVRLTVYDNISNYDVTAPVNTESYLLKIPDLDLIPLNEPIEDNSVR